MGRLHIIIKGNVQGVGFRFFVKNHARDLGLLGFVKNLPDGSVEVVAEGQEFLLNQLVDRCREGPMRSRVDEVLYALEVQQGEFKNFDIR